MPARSASLDVMHPVHFLNIGGVGSLPFELALLEVPPVRVVSTHGVLHVLTWIHGSPIELDIFGEGWAVDHISPVHVGPRRGSA